MMLTKDLTKRPRPLYPCILFSTPGQSCSILSATVRLFAFVFKEDDDHYIIINSIQLEYKYKHEYKHENCPYLMARFHDKTWEIFSGEIKSSGHA